MSKFVNVIVGAAMVGVGLVTNQPWLVKMGIATTITAVASLLLAPSMKAKRSGETSVQLGEVARSGIFGEGSTAGSLVDAFNFGGDYGTDWTVLVLALADHRCEALTGFYVNDKYVAFTGNGLVPGYRDQLRVHWCPGAWDDAVPDWVLANAPVVGGTATWTADDRGRGVAKMFVAYKADKSDAKHPVWSSGQPQFLWVVKGLLCYQARKDSSIGGDGAHRWDDPATREWTANLIDCRYTWVRGIYAGDQVDDPAMLLLGRGLSDIEAPPANVFAPANVCDEAVSLAAGGTEPRYRIGGVFGGDEAYIDTEDDFMAACGGWLVERDGSIELVPGAAQAVVWDISDNDLVVGAAVKANDFRTKTDNEWVNTVAAKYIEPAQKWRDHAAPVRRIPADIIADREPRVAQPTLSLVTSGTQAQRVAEQQRRLGRLPRTRELTLPPRLIGVQHGDWLRWTSRRYGVKPATVPPGPLLFRVESDSQDEKWQNRISLRQVASAAYGWTTDDERTDGAVAVDNPDPDFGAAPSDDDWSFEATVTSAGALIPVLRFSGAVPSDSISAVYFEYALGVTAPDIEIDSLWTSAGTGNAGVTEWLVPGVAEGETYWGAISYQIGASRTERLLLGPVDTSLEGIAPGAPVDVAGVGGSLVADIGWTNATSPNLSFSRVHRNTIDSLTGSTLVSGDMASSPGAGMSFHDEPAAGDWYYFVTHYNSAGTASTAIGTGLVSVTA